jgi:hypothetical protein
VAPVTKQYLREDPDVRRDPLEARRDVIGAFAEAGGLVIDTRALHVLLRAVQDEPALAQSVRERMRDQRGVLRASDAEELVKDVQGSAR